MTDTATLLEAVKALHAPVGHPDHLHCEPCSEHMEWGAESWPCTTAKTVYTEAEIAAAQPSTKPVNLAHCTVDVSPYTDVVNLYADERVRAAIEASTMDLALSRAPAGATDVRGHWTEERNRERCYEVTARVPKTLADLSE